MKSVNVVFMLWLQIIFNIDMSETTLRKDSFYYSSDGEYVVVFPWINIPYSSVSFLLRAISSKRPNHKIGGSIIYTGLLVYPPFSYLLLECFIINNWLLE